MRFGCTHRQWIGRVALLGFLAGSGLPGCRRDEPAGKSAAPAPAPKEWLTEITSDSGLDFTYESGPYGHLYMPEIMGSGVALMDLDGDGDLDVYLTNGHNDLPALEGSGDLTNRYFRQEPDGRFMDATAESGLGDTGYGMGLAVGDIDNDGDRDIYITNLGPDKLYRNRGDGTFENVTGSAGIDVPSWSASACLLDYDRDGYLDVFVTQYVAFYAQKTCSDAAGRPDYCGPLSFSPLPDVLLRNNGDGTFADASAAAGIHSVPAGAGLGAVCEDLNGDGWMDVYVTNDAYANNLWINRGDGTFRDDALVLGVAYNMHGHAEAGMGIVAADLDNDGHIDLFMTHLLSESNTLYRNTGRGGFVDATATSGLGETSLSFTGFGTGAFDLELDGDLDIAVVNGKVRLGGEIHPSQIGPPFDIYAEPNLLYTNDGKGRFALIKAEAAAFRNRVEVTRGFATGDLDGDGDLDVIVSNIESPTRIYRNDAPRKGAWLAVRGVDPRLNRDAYGATVAVTAGGRTLQRTITSAFSYLSASEPIAHFGLGEVEQVDAIEVRWPDGLSERFPGGAVDRTVKVLRGFGTALP